MPKKNIEHLTKKQFKVKITNIKNLQKMGGDNDDKERNYCIVKIYRKY